MRSIEDNIIIKKSHNFESNSFKIKASSKAFDILSSKLYSDTKLAIIRELSANAWDSHIRANTKYKPFDVHLPNVLEPFFAIRDYGTGLSHQDVMEIYTTYFESTKTETNSEVGYLGIGSKSPFSYTDLFFVTSWFDGKKRSYSMVKGNNGCPEINFMEITDSDEPCGLEVKFACQADDINLFINKATNIYRTFPIKPNIIGNNSTDIISKRKILLRGHNWKLYQINGLNHQTAIMGPIGYPIRGQYVKGNVKGTLILYNLNIDIIFPIGALDLTANREELQYSNRTQSTLNETLTIIYEEIVREINEKLSKCSCLWDALSLYLNKFKPHITSYLEEIIIKDIKWHNNDSQTKMSLKTHLKTDWEGKITLFIKSKDRIKVIHDQASINVKKNTILIVNDLDLPYRNRIRNWMNKEKDKVEQVYLFETDNWSEKNEAILHRDLHTFPSHYKLLSTIPKVTREKTIHTYRKSNRYNGYIFNNPRWEPTTIDFCLQGIYMTLKRGKPVYKDEKISDYKVSETLRCLEYMKAKPDSLYGITQRCLPKTLNLPYWKNLFVYAEEVLENFIKINSLGNILKESNPEKFVDFNLFREISKYITKPSPIKEFVDDFKNLTQEHKNNLNAVVSLAYCIDYKLEKEDIFEKIEKIKDLYPLLKWIGYVGSEEKYRDLAVYIELMDNRR